MILDVNFVSLDAARYLRPRADTLMISILDIEERQNHTLPRLAGYRSVLSLRFEDTCEETNFFEVGAWPDEPSAAEQARFSQGAGEKVPVLEDASKIVEFVLGHHATTAPLHLLVHCFAGISRSGAVARWVEETLVVPRLNEGNASTDHANKRLLRLLVKAHGLYEQTQVVARDCGPERG